MTFPEGEKRIWVQYSSWCNRCGMKILLITDHPGDDGDEPNVWVHQRTLKQMCEISQPYAVPGNNELEFEGHYDDVVW